jgi:hypothetical protein
MIGPETNFQKTTNYYKIKLLTNEPCTPKQNHIAEGTLGHMCWHWLTILASKASFPVIVEFWLGMDC